MGETVPATNDRAPFLPWISLVEDQPARPALWTVPPETLTPRGAVDGASGRDGSWPTLGACLGRSTASARHRHAESVRVRACGPGRYGLSASIPWGTDGPTRGSARGPRYRRTSHGLYVPADVERTVEQRIVEAAALLHGWGGVTGWAALRWLGGCWFDGWQHDGRTPAPVPLAVGQNHPMAEQDGILVSNAGVPASPPDACRRRTTHDASAECRLRDATGPRRPGGGEDLRQGGVRRPGVHRRAPGLRRARAQRQDRRRDGSRLLAAAD